MATPIVVVSSGGVPVTEVTSGFGTPVTVATNGYGMAVTIVTSGGLPVVGSGSAPLRQRQSICVATSPTKWAVTRMAPLFPR